jgi:small subunit ribosomal protein S14
MAKTSSVQKNNKRRRISTRLRARRLELKAVIMNKSLPLEQRFEAQMKMNAMPRDASKCRVRNRCEITGRPRGYYRKFRMSRICLRSLAGLGMLPGVIKGSW